MISILHHGNVPRLFVKCWHCGCEFSYDEEDVKKSANGNEYIICPDCKDAIGLMDKDKPEIPEEVFDSYERKREGFLVDGRWKEEGRMTGNEIVKAIYEADEKGILNIEESDFFEDGDKLFVISIHEPEDGWEEE